MTHYIIVFLMGVALGALLFSLAYWRGIREGRRRQEARIAKELEAVEALVDPLIKAMGLGEEAKKELEAFTNRLSKALRSGEINAVDKELEASTIRLYQALAPLEEAKGEG